MKKFLGILGILGLVVVACNNDDDGLGGTAVPPRLLSEVIEENETEIQEYLETHFYRLDPDANNRVVIDTIAGENAGETPLSTFVKDTLINVSAIQFNLDDGEEDIPHKLYYISIRNGEGGSPTVADSTLLRFEGKLLDNTNFDATADFSWQELPFFIRGFSNGIAKLKAGTNAGVEEMPDGTVQFSDSGIGLIIIPSGLAYFNSPPTASIPAYAPLVFSVEVGLFIEDTDNDNDGIPSIDEDLNGNGDIFDDNTDNDVEREQGLLLGIPNFQDIDDDGDGVLTREEISDENGNIIFPYPDSNNDGTPDYLDPDVLREVDN